MRCPAKIATSAAMSTGSSRERRTSIGGDDAEDGEAHRRERPEKADGDGAQRDVGGDPPEDRRQRADGGAEIRCNEKDADEREDSPGQQGAGGGSVTCPA